MHKKTFKRSVPGTQKIRAPQHLSRIKDHEGNEDDENNHFRLPSLQKRQTWKEADTASSSYDRSSTATSVSWSEEMEEVNTSKLRQQWDAVERTLYDEDDQVPAGIVFDECTQWKTQMLHIRVVGKNIANNTVNTEEHNGLVKSEENLIGEQQNDETVRGCGLSAKRTVEPIKQKSLIKARDNILNILFEYVCSELFTNKENETDAISENFSESLKITPSTIHSGTSTARGLGTSGCREKSITNKNCEDKHTIGETNLFDMQDLLNTENSQRIYSSNIWKQSQERRDATSTSEEKIITPYLGRNKLGTVFNEKIVVSPVPFVVSTRQSFSTLRTTPIRFFTESYEISSKLGSGKSTTAAFRTQARKLSMPTAPNIHSAWQAPVCPTVWPKNVKLAPIDTSRLPSSKHRSLAPSPAPLRSNRKSLTPISRTMLPSSARRVHSNDQEPLEIQGKRITIGQSANSHLRAAGWEAGPRSNKSRKQKIRGRNEK